MSDYQSILDELAPPVDEEVLNQPVEAIPLELSSQLSDLRVAVAGLEGKVTDARIDVTEARRRVSRIQSEVVESTQATDKALRQSAADMRQLQAEQENGQRLIDGCSDAIAIHGPRIELLEQRMVKVGEALNLHQKELAKVKRQRVTVGHILLGIIAIAAVTNAYLSLSASLSFEGRLQQIENLNY